MSINGTIPVLMDVDTGIDDAMAIAMAVASPEIELLGVTTVAGNVSRDRATNNTLRVLEHLGASTVPVFAGMAKPLSRAHVDAAEVHGNDGLGGAPFPEPGRSEEAMTAPEFIVQTARTQSGNLTLVFVGPLTNLAVALALEPDLPSMVTRTVIMGGAFDVPGNTTPAAEFNILVDPEAARIVAESDLNVTWIGLDVTHHALLYRSDWDRLDGNDNPTAALVREVCRRRFIERNRESEYLHDPLAVAVVLRDGLVTCDRSAVAVDTSIRETAGATRMFVDSRAPQQLVARQLDQQAFRNLFASVLDLPIEDQMPAGR